VIIGNHGKTASVSTIAIGKLDTASHITKNRLESLPLGIHARGRYFEPITRGIL
jgi:hypothetical protein